jgi:hypothetical protein
MTLQPIQKLYCRVYMNGAVAALSLLALPSGAAELACPEQIRVAYADTELPPYVLGTGTAFQRPAGLFVDWSRSALERLGCTHVVQEFRLPYNRIVAYMGAGMVDIRVTGGFRTDVLDLMRFPMRDGQPDAALAVAEANTRLYVIKGARPLQWDGKVLRMGDAVAVAGTVRGHFSEKVLQSRKFEFESASSWESNVKKLFAGRVAAIAGPDSVVDALPERNQMDMLEPPVQYDLFFAPVSRQFFEKYPAFTQRFWFEMCRESRSTFRKLPACREK